MRMPSTPWIALLLVWVCVGGHAQSIQVVTEDTSYSYLQNGKVVGTATAVVDATLQRAGLHHYRIAIYPWARAYDMAQQQANVLIYLMARTPVREKQFKWVGEIERIEHHFYKLRARTDIQVHELQDAKQYSVGVVRDDVRHHYLKDRGFSKMVVSASNRDNFLRLVNQQVELLPMPVNDVAMLCKEIQIDCATLEKVYTLDELATGLYMAYSRATDDETVARTRAAFDSLKAEGILKQLMSGAN